MIASIIFDGEKITQLPKITTELCHFPVQRSLIIELDCKTSKTDFCGRVSFERLLYCYQMD